MRIYFAASVRGGSWNRANYREIVDHLKLYGAVLTEHLAETDEEDLSQFTDQELFRQDLEWLGTADLLIAEVSSPSHGVGYEIGKAEEYGIPILCLYQESRDRRLSAMIEGNSKCDVRRYKDIEEAKKLIDEYMHT